MSVIFNYSLAPNLWYIFGKSQLQAVWGIRGLVIKDNTAVKHIDIPTPIGGLIIIETEVSQLLNKRYYNY